ncbi:hypothetical protein EDC01DRAFT_760507 [Geopyxis carbonaria]|nr:hypothetical protein EDC01DRAFT_760507 [Geopyxis carbonaria]
MSGSPIRNVGAETDDAKPACELDDEKFDFLPTFALSITLPPERTISIQNYEIQHLCPKERAATNTFRTPVSLSLAFKLQQIMNLGFEPPEGKRIRRANRQDYTERWKDFLHYWGPQFGVTFGGVDDHLYQDLVNQDVVILDVVGPLHNIAMFSNNMAMNGTPPQPNRGLLFMRQRLNEFVNSISKDVQSTYNVRRSICQSKRSTTVREYNDLHLTEMEFFYFQMKATMYYPSDPSEALLLKPSKQYRKNRPMSTPHRVSDTASSSGSTIEMVSSNEFTPAHKKQTNSSSPEEGPCYYNYTFQTAELTHFLRVGDETFRALKPFFFKHRVVLASEPILKSEYIKEQGLSFCAQRKKDLMVALRELQTFGVSSKPFALWSPIKSPTKSPVYFASGSVINSQTCGSLHLTKRGENSRAKDIEEVQLRSKPPQKSNAQSFYVQIDGSPTLKLTNRERSKTITIVPKIPEKIGAGWQLVAKPRATSSPAKLASGFPKKDVRFSDTVEIATVAQDNIIESFTIQESFHSIAKFMENGNEVSPSGENSVYTVPQRRSETGPKKGPKLRVETTISPIKTLSQMVKHDVPEEIDTSTRKAQGQGGIQSNIEGPWDTYLPPPPHPPPQHHYPSVSPDHLSGGYPTATLPPTDPAVIWQEFPPSDNYSWPPVSSYGAGGNGIPELSSQYPRFERTRPPAPSFPYTGSPGRYSVTPNYIRASPKKNYLNRGQQFRNQIPRFSFDENQHPSFHKDQARPFEQTRSNYNGSYQSIRVNENYQPGDQTQRVRTSRPKFTRDTQEDDELSLENGMPYRLRPPPLTGPRTIR